VRIPPPSFFRGVNTPVRGIEVLPQGKKGKTDEQV